MGEVLHAIDFDQLQIENKQYLAKIEERNTELIKLKVTAGNTIQILNQHRKRLQSLSEESRKLRAEITQRKDLLSKLQSESSIVDLEMQKADRIYQKLSDQIQEYKVPQVLEYVTLKVYSLISF